MSTEGNLLSAVLNDRHIHVLMQANVDTLLKTHSDIWQGIKEHYDMYGTVPAPDVILKKFPDFDYDKDIKGTEYLLDEVRTEFLDNGVRSMIRSAANAVQDHKAGDALDRLIKDAAKLKRMTSKVRDIDAGDADAAASYYEQVARQRENGGLGVMTGLPAFDTCLPSGIMPGHFGVILAYPAIGKSWLMAYFAVLAWRSGKTPLIISLEMTEAEVRNRIYTIIGNGRWSHRDLSAGRVDAKEFKEWHQKVFVGKPPIHIISSDSEGGVTPIVVQGKIDQYKPSLVLLDYLNLMDSNERAESETVKMKQLSRQLKLAAVADSIPIVAISSATPDNVSDMNSAPTLGQVSWSKQISYDADWLIALGRETNSDVIQVVFRKNRHGMLGEFYLTVDFDKGKFIYRGIDP